MRAFVLGGGGARGAHQCGQLSYAVSKLGMPDFIVGNSAGALNGGALGFTGVDGMRKLWEGISNLADIFMPIPNVEGLMSSAPLTKLVDEHITGKPSLEVVCTYTDLDSGLTCYASTDDMSLDEFKWRLVASASIPGIVQPQKGQYCDGGVRMNIPLREAIDRGATEVIVFLCSPETLPATSGPYNLESIFTRSLDCLMQELVDEQMKLDPYVDVKVIQPAPGFSMGVLDFNREKIAAAISDGEAAAKAVLG